VPLHSTSGQLAFRAPAEGSYTVTLEYPRYRPLLVIAVTCLIVGMIALARRPRGTGERAA
jgi:hypothetical protein